MRPLKIRIVSLGSFFVALFFSTILYAQLDYEHLRAAYFEQTNDAAELVDVPTVIWNNDVDENWPTGFFCPYRKETHDINDSGDDVVSPLRTWVIGNPQNEIPFHEEDPNGPYAGYVPLATTGILQYFGASWVIPSDNRCPEDVENEINPDTGQPYVTTNYITAVPRPSILSVDPPIGNSVTFRLLKPYDYTNLPTGELPSSILLYAIPTNGSAPVPIDIPIDASENTVDITFTVGPGGDVDLVTSITYQLGVLAMYGGIGTPLNLNPLDYDEPNEFPEVIDLDGIPALSRTFIHPFVLEFDGADTQDPTVSITAPADGATVSGIVTISADATDNVAVDRVEFLVDGNLMGSDSTAPYAYNWPTTIDDNGSHNLSARAIDTSGNDTTSALVPITVNNLDTEDPTVSITAPADGATVSGIVTISADATDNVAVDRVEFLVDGNLMGSDSTAPYAYNWPTTIDDNGSHNLSARAIDTSGNDTTSALVPITVNNLDTEDPTVSITAPADGATVSGIVTISADATDNVAVDRVEFLVDGNLMGSDSTAPYAYNWPTTIDDNGSHNLSARAIDTSGNDTTSALVPITVNNLDTEDPTVSITAPADGATVSGIVTISADATDNVAVDRVEFLVDGNLMGSDSTAPYAYNWPTTIDDNGPHNLSARAIDTSGNDTTSALVPITVDNADTEDPIVSITAPADGATVSGNITITVNASDNVGVTRVEYFLDGNPLGQNTSSPFSFSWDTTQTSNGVYPLSAIAYDTSENPSLEDEISVTVDNTIPGDTEPPQVSITYPPEGIILSGVFDVLATATDNVGVNSVELYLNDGQDEMLIGSDVTPPYEILFDTTLYADGDYLLIAKAYDDAENVGMSSFPVTLNQGVDALPPQLDLLAPQEGETLTGDVLVSVNAWDNINVYFIMVVIKWGIYEDSIGVEYNSSYDFNFDTTRFDNGPYILMARAVDHDGNITDKEINVFINNPDGSDETPPEVTITHPTGDTPISGLINYSAEATDNVSVSFVDFYIDGGLLFTDDAPPYEFSDLDTTNYVDGDHEFWVRAWDAAGNFDDHILTVSIEQSIDLIPPTITIATPKDGISVSGKIRMQAEATDNFSIDKVEYYVDGGFLGTGFSTQYWRYLESTNFSNGNHTIMARAFDDAGNISEDEITLIVRNPLPCLGDLDEDGFVGATDFLDLLAAWGENPGHPADLDGDGFVGATDFLDLLAYWGECDDGLGVNIAFDKQTSYSSEQSGQVFSFEHEVSDLENRVLLVDIAFHADLGVTVQANGRSLELFSTGTSVPQEGPPLRLMNWYLFAPDVGLNTIEVTFPQIVDHVVIGARSYAGVVQEISPYGGGISIGSGSTNNPTCTEIQSSDNYLVLSTIAIGHAGISLTPGQGQKKRFQAENNASNPLLLSTASDKSGADQTGMCWEIPGGSHRFVKYTHSLRPAIGIEFDKARTLHSTFPNGASTFNLEYSVPNKNNRILLVEIAHRSGEVVNSVFADGRALTKKDSGGNGNFARGELWYLIDPNSAHNDIMVEFSNPVQYAVITARSYSGVDQTNPFSNEFLMQSGESPEASLIVPTSPGERAIDMLVQAEGSSPIVGDIQKKRYQDQDSSSDPILFSAGSDERGNGDTEMSWQINGGAGTRWFMMGWALQPSTN